MTRQIIFDITPGPGGGWVVTRRGASQPLGRVERKADAIARARELAERFDLAKVVVHGQDQSVQVEHTYGKLTHPRKDE